MTINSFFYSEGDDFLKLKVYKGTLKLYFRRGDGYVIGDIEYVNFNGHEFDRTDDTLYAMYVCYQASYYSIMDVINHAERLFPHIVKDVA